MYLLRAAVFVDKSASVAKPHVNPLIHENDNISKYCGANSNRQMGMTSRL